MLETNPFLSVIIEQDKKKKTQNIIYQFDIYKHYILE